MVWQTAFIQVNPLVFKKARIPSLRQGQHNFPQTCKKIVVVLCVTKLFICNYLSAEVKTTAVTRPLASTTEHLGPIRCCLHRCASTGWAVTQCQEMDTKWSSIWEFDRASLSWFVILFQYNCVITLNFLPGFIWVNFSWVFSATETRGLSSQQEAFSLCFNRAAFLNLVPPFYFLGFYLHSSSLTV